MNLFKSIVLISSSILLLTACGDDDEVVPNPLPTIEKATVAYETLWNINVGKGTQQQFLNLKMAYGYDHLYVADVSGVVKAVNVETGQKIWSTNVKDPISAGVTVGSDMVLVATREGSVIALNAKTGKEKWISQVSSEVIAAPAVGDGYVVVNTVDGFVVALSAETGERQWFYDRVLPALTLRGTAAPVVTRGAAIAGFASGKVGVFILESGQLAWEKQITPPSGRSDLERLVDIDAQPIVFGGELYAASYNGNLASIDLRNGESLWSRELSAFKDMSIDEQTLLVTHDNSYVSSLNRNNGALLWTQKAMFLRDLTTPVSFGNHIVAGDFSGYLHMMDKSDGRLIGQHEVSKSIDYINCFDEDDDCNFSRFEDIKISSSPLVVDDKLLVLTNNGYLIAYKLKK